MKIAINGSLGSGKSTVAKMLAAELNWPYVATGARFREMARERNMDVASFSRYAEENPYVDEAIDNWLKSFNDVDESLVIDSRMAPFFIHDAFRVRLVVSDTEGARRIFQDEARGEEERFGSMEAAKEAYRVRSQSERFRYYGRYNVDVEDLSQYDLVLDTSTMSPDEVCRRIKAQALAKA